MFRALPSCWQSIALQREGLCFSHSLTQKTRVRYILTLYSVYVGGIATLWLLLHKIVNLYCFIIMIWTTFEPVYSISCPKHSCWHWCNWHLIFQQPSCLTSNWAILSCHSSQPLRSPCTCCGLSLAFVTIGCWYAAEHTAKNVNLCRAVGTKQENRHKNKLSTRSLQNKAPCPPSWY